MRLTQKFMMSGYDHYGASRTKPSVSGWHTLSKSPTEDIADNLELLRERSRDLYSGGGPLGRGAIDRILMNAVGSGLRLNCRIDAKILGMTEDEAEEWEATTEREFALWSESKNCDLTRGMTFYELQNLALKSTFINGDALVLLPLRKTAGFPYDLRIQLIEGDRLHNPFYKPAGVMIDNGVEIDNDGKPVAYYIANRHPRSELSYQPRLEYLRIPAFGPITSKRNVIHLCPMERIGQHRGLPFLAPVIETLKQLGRYSDAELMAAVIGGIFAVFFEHGAKDENDEFLSDDELVSKLEGDAEKESEWQEALSSINSNDMYGMIMDLPKRTSAKSLTPGRPNSAFDAFVMSMVRQVGSALGIPAEVLFLNFQASYSASRGALLEAWKVFKYWRSWWEINFCQPIYEEWLEEAVLKGRVIAPGYFDDPVKRYAYTWADWTGPSQGQLNPVQEVQAAVLRVGNGFSTRQKESAELTGTDFELNHRQRVKEEKLRKELSQYVENI